MHFRGCPCTKRFPTVQNLKRPEWNRWNTAFCSWTYIYIYAKNPFQRFKSLNFKHLLYYIYMIYVDRFLLSQLPLGGHPRHTGARKSFSIYEKLQAIREVDRLVEEGVTSGIEKRVMETFKHLFAGSKGYKSGVLGRWLTQADAH